MRITHPIKRVTKYKQQSEYLYASCNQHTIQHCSTTNGSADNMQTLTIKRKKTKGQFDLENWAGEKSWRGCLPVCMAASMHMIVLVFGLFFGTWPALCCTPDSFCIPMLTMLPASAIFFFCKQTTTHTVNHLTFQRWNIFVSRPNGFFKLKTS